MIKRCEIIRNLLAISRQSNFFTSFQMTHLSATVQESHSDFVTFIRYSKSVSCRSKYITYKGACCGIKQNTKLKLCAASGPSRTLNHPFATNSCQNAKVGFVLILYWPERYITGFKLVVLYEPSRELDGSRDCWYNMESFSCEVCVNCKLKSAKSSISLFMFLVHILFREDRRSSL